MKGGAALLQDSPRHGECSFGWGAGGRDCQETASDAAEYREAGSGRRCRPVAKDVFGDMASHRSGILDVVGHLRSC